MPSPVPKVSQLVITEFFIIHARYFDVDAAGHGALTEQISMQVKQGFEGLFNPSATDWKEKAVADADQAFDGIFSAEGFIG